MKSFAVAALLAGIASAKSCTNLNIPITATARNGDFHLTAPSTNQEATDFILDLTQNGKNLTQELLKGYKTVSHKYTVSATYCQPDDGPSKVLQILTHGIGFDKTYWDLSFDKYNYSYVDEAVDKRGYSTFAWDRLGIAASSHGPAVDVIQAPLEVDALRFLTVNLGAGKIKGIKTGFKKIVHIGHSFGSALTYELTAMYPGISDGIALTGFSQDPSFIPYFALGGNFVVANKVAKFSKYPDGYLAAGDASAVQTNFLAPGDYDPAILAFAFKGGQPVTVGELLTTGGSIASVNDFAGPVHIITGERDVPFCGGNCYGMSGKYPNIPAMSKPKFPKASKFDVSIIPGAGHGLNLQYTHPLTYAAMLDGFESTGNGPNSTSTKSSKHPHARV